MPPGAHSHVFEWFSALPQMLICAVMALSLASIQNAGLKNAAGIKMKDDGIRYFAMACGVWAFVGGLEILKFHFGPLPSSPGYPLFRVLYDFIRGLASIFNTIFLFWSVRYLDAFNLNAKPEPPALVRPILRILNA